MLDSYVGRCNHESSCGYHYSPKDYFHDNPDSNYSRNFPIHQSYHTHRSKPNRATIQFMPSHFVIDYYSQESHFVKFLLSIFSKEDVVRVCKAYCLGGTSKRETVFWQIDIDGNIRSGKIIQYNQENGHRAKQIDWMHSRLIKKGLLSKDFSLGQCLFGEHLLNLDRNAIVALVESEKSAVIGKAQFPDYLWLAVGAKGQLKPEKLYVLKNRTVILFPDIDAQKEWNEKAKLLTFCNVTVSDILLRYATDEDRKNKIDIADWIVKQRMENAVQ